MEATASTSATSSNEDNTGLNKRLQMTSTTTALAQRRKEFMERRRNKSRQSTTAISMVDSDSSDDSGEDSTNNNDGDENRDDDESTLMDEFVSKRTEVPPPPPGPPPPAAAAPPAQPKPLSKTLEALLSVTANTEIDQRSNEDDDSINDDEMNCIVNDVSQHSRSRTLRGSFYASSPNMTPTSRRSNRTSSHRLNDGSSRSSSLDYNTENSDSSDSNNNNNIGGIAEVVDQLSPRSLNQDDKDDDDDDMNNLLKDFLQTIEAYSRDEESQLDDRSQHVGTFNSDEEDLSALVLLATADVGGGGGATTTTETTNGGTKATSSPRVQLVEDRDLIDHVFENIENATCNRFGHKEDEQQHRVASSANVLVPSYKSDPINVLDEVDNSIIIDDDQDDIADCTVDTDDRNKNPSGNTVPPSPLSFLSKIPTPKDIGKWVSTFDDVTCVTNSETGEKFPAVADWVDKAFETVEETFCQMTTGRPKEPSNNHHDDLGRHQFLSMEQDALDTVFETVEEHVCSESESRSTMLLMTDEEVTTAFGSTISGTPQNLSRPSLSPSSASLFGSSSFLSPKSQVSDSSASTTTSFSFNDHARNGSALASKHSSFSRSPVSMDNTRKSINNLLSSSNESDSDLDDDQFINVLHEYGFKDTAVQNDNSTTNHSTRGFHQHQPEPLYVIKEEVSTSRSGSEQQHQSRATTGVAPVSSCPPSGLDPLAEAAANAASAIDASLKAAEAQQEQLFAQLDSYSMSSRGSTFSMSVNSTTFLARRVRATNGGFTDSCFGFDKDGGWKNAKDFFFYDEDEAREWVEEFRAGLEGAVDRVADALDMNVCGHERDDSRNYFEDDGDDTIHAVHTQPKTKNLSSVMRFPSPTNMSITPTAIPTSVRIRSRKIGTTPVSGGQSVQSTPSDEVTNFSLLTRRPENDEGKESREPESTKRLAGRNVPDQRQAADPSSPQDGSRFKGSNCEEIPEEINAKRVEGNSQYAQQVTGSAESNIDCNDMKEGNLSMHFDLDCRQESQDEDPPRIKSPKSSETHNTFETQKTADETVATLQEADDGCDYSEVKECLVKRIENDIEENDRSMPVVSMEMTSTFSNNDEKSSPQINRTRDVSNKEAEDFAVGNGVSGILKTNDIDSVDSVEDHAIKESAVPDGQCLDSARILPLPLSPVASFTATIGNFSQHNRNKDNTSGHSRTSVHGMLSAAFSCSTGAAGEFAQDENKDVPKDDFEGVVIDGVMSVKHNSKTYGQADKNQVSIEGVDESIVRDSPTIDRPARNYFAKDGSSSSNEYDDLEQKHLKSSESASDEDDMWQLRPTCTDIVVYEEKPAAMLNNVSETGGLLYLWLYMIWCSLTFWLRVNGGDSSEDHTRKKEEIEQKRISIENVLSRMSRSEDDDNSDGQPIKKILSNDILESMPSLEQQLSHTVETTMTETKIS